MLSIRKQDIYRLTRLSTDNTLSTVPINNYLYKKKKKKSNKDDRTY